ncbi:hypothetical protein PISL3812_00592 [Talaromyces islandicus]|uniref:RNase III domain-containing protein n=1 Tax=Talaromyces islandicus TaxID=28573 RepID=A0A0U1LM90_TALIS|nr:hypothetical protein PISL3812_00592 [Talaromyces islandicus]
MGEKRQHKDGNSSPGRAITSKKAKGNHFHDESEIKRPNTGVDRTNDGETLIEKLHGVVNEIVKHPEALGSHPKRSSVLNIASQLQTVLAAASLPPDTTPTHVHPSKKDKGLPELPPISDASLARAVFTHPGAHTNNNVEGPDETSYDRLEVLGDAYIEVFATKLIWRRFPNIPAGRISQIREELVKNETLAEYATKYGFDTRLSIPPDHRDQPKRWKKTKGDVFEAYVAAVVLSNPVDGDEIVENWLTQLWQPKLTGIQSVQSVLKAKELLAKKVMGKGIKLRYVDERPPERLSGGMQTFYVGVYLTGWGWDNQHLGSGRGLSKTIAGDNAAQEALRNVPLIDQVADAKLASGAKANDIQ